VLNIRQRTGYLFLAVVLGHVILISAQVNTRSGVRVLEVVTFGIFSEIQRGAAALAGGWTGLWSGYVDLRAVHAENQALRREVLELRMQLQEQRALAQRSVTLQELLDLRRGTPLQTVAAEIIAADATPGFRTVTINRGSRHGIEPDMAVLAAGGVVGRVIGVVAPHAAKVQLLVGRNAAAGALIERSRAGGVVMGQDGDPPLLMEYVSNLADVTPGDLVVTSGIEGIYPTGFVIGTVEVVERGSGLYKTIRVRPAVDFSGLQQVLVVTTRPPAPTDEASG
jgi:rod shape-determining protein MreC